MPESHRRFQFRLVNDLISGLVPYLIYFSFLLFPFAHFFLFLPLLSPHISLPPSLKSAKYHDIDVIVLMLSHCMTLWSSGLVSSHFLCLEILYVSFKNEYILNKIAFEQNLVFPMSILNRSRAIANNPRLQSGNQLQQFHIKISPTLSVLLLYDRNYCVNHSPFSSL